MGGSAWELKIDRKRLQEKENNDLKEGGERTNEKTNKYGKDNVQRQSFSFEKKTFRACQKMVNGENGGMRGAAGEDYRRG